MTKKTELLSTEKQETDLNAIMRGLVHELRNPLSAILTASSLLRGNPDLDEETSMLLEVMQNESRRMNRILTEFAYFVRPPLGPPEELDLSQLARDTVREMREENQLPPTIQVQDRLPQQLMALADPAQMRRSLGNILKNAVEALPNGGLITLEGTVSGKSALLRVLDNGSGFDDNSLRDAFKPFFSTRAQGTGLGLSIARELVGHSGGVIRLETLAEGALVEIALPRPQGASE